MRVHDDQGEKSLKRVLSGEYAPDSPHIDASLHDVVQGAGRTVGIPKHKKDPGRGTSEAISQSTINAMSTVDNGRSSSLYR